MIFVQLQSRERSRNPPLIASSYNDKTYEREMRIKKRGTKIIRMRRRRLEKEIIQKLSNQKANNDEIEDDLKAQIKKEMVMME